MPFMVRLFINNSTTEQLNSTLKLKNIDVLLNYRISIVPQHQAVKPLALSIKIKYFPLGND